jgi:hypothetical protein
MVGGDGHRGTGNSDRKSRLVKMTRLVMRRGRRVMLGFVGFVRQRL